MGNLESSALLCCSDLNSRQEGDVKLDQIEGRIVPVEEDTPQWGIGSRQYVDSENSSYNHQAFGRIDDYNQTPSYYSPYDLHNLAPDHGKMMIGKEARESSSSRKSKNFEYLNNVVKFSLSKSNKINVHPSYDDMVNEGVLDRVSVNHDNTIQNEFNKRRNKNEDIDNENDLVLYSSLNNFNIDTPLKNNFNPTSSLINEPKQILKPAQKEESKIGSNRYTKESVLKDSKFEQSQFTTSMLNQNDNPVENLPNEYQNNNSNKILNNDDKIDELFGDNETNERDESNMHHKDQNGLINDEFNESIKPEQTPEEINEQIKQSINQRYEEEKLDKSSEQRNNDESIKEISMSSKDHEDLFGMKIPPSYNSRIRRKFKNIKRKLKVLLPVQARISKNGLNLSNQDMASSYKASSKGDSYYDDQESGTYRGYPKKTQSSTDIINWSCVDIEDPENIRQEYCGQYEDDKDDLYQIEEEDSIDVASELMSKNNDGDLAVIPTTDKVVYQGFLKKFSSKTSKYIKRWCVLTENTFGYFKCKNDAAPLFAIELKSICRIVQRNHTHLGAAKYKFEIIPLYSDFTNESDQGCRDQYLNLYEELDLNNDILETYSFNKDFDYEYEDIHKIQSQSLKQKAKEIIEHMSRISYIHRKEDNNDNEHLLSAYSPTKSLGSRQRSFSEDKEINEHFKREYEDEQPQLQLKKALKSFTITPNKFSKLIERRRSLDDSQTSRLDKNEDAIDTKKTYIFGCDDRNAFECWVSLINAGTI